jgi:hypothetical protein
MRLRRFGWVLTAAVLAFCASGVLGAPQAEARVLVRFGGPAIYAVPVYGPPPPVYYGPPPIYYPVGVAYAPRVIYRRVVVHHYRHVVYHHVVRHSCSCCSCGCR